MPGLASIAGPRGPSGVMPTQAPSFSVLTIARSAASPPRELEPAIDAMPKWPTAAAMMRPSRWPEISMWIGTSRGQAIGIIRSLPCQKARMKGRLSWK
jgi:hypothetical protein